MKRMCHTLALIAVVFVAAIITPAAQGSSTIRRTSLGI